MCNDRSQHRYHLVVQDTWHACDIHVANCWASPFLSMLAFRPWDVNVHRQAQASSVEKPSLVLMVQEVVQEVVTPTLHDGESYSQ